MAFLIGLAGLGDLSKRVEGRLACLDDQGTRRLAQGLRRPGRQPGQVIEERDDRNGESAECLNRQASLHGGAVAKGACDDFRPFCDPLAKAGQPTDQGEHLHRIDVIALGGECLAIDDVWGMSIGLEHPFDDLGGEPILVHREDAWGVLRLGSKTHHELKPRRRRQRSQGGDCLMDDRAPSRNVNDEIPRAKRRRHDLGEPQENQNGHLRVMLQQCVPGG